MSRQPRLPRPGPLYGYHAEPQDQSRKVALLRTARMALAPGFYRTMVMLLAAAGLLVMFSGSATAQQPLATTTPVADDMIRAAGCSELIVNGGFEVTGLGWTLIMSGQPPLYTTAPVFAGSRSLRIGNVDRPNLPETSAVEQIVTLPLAGSIVLGFHVYPIHEGQLDNDHQYLDIYDVSTNQLIARPWEELSNARQWQFLQFDFTGLQGRALRLVFGVNNDGGNGRTAFYLDDVSLIACDIAPGYTPTVPPTVPIPTVSTPTATPIIISPISPTPTLLPYPTSTPVPPLQPGCTSANYVQNGDFETSGGWIFGQDPVPPVYSGEQRHSGLRSVRLGNPPDPGTVNRVSYSSVRQLVSLPASAGSATLSWWHYSRSEAGNTTWPGRLEDRQEVILLRPDLSTRAILFRQRINTGGWQQAAVDLTPYLGESLYIYFNVYNNGDGLRTWLYLDDVYLSICYATVTAGGPVSGTAPGAVSARINAAQADIARTRNGSSRAGILAPQATGEGKETTPEAEQTISLAQADRTMRKTSWLILGGLAMVTVTGAALWHIGDRKT